MLGMLFSNLFHLPMFFTRADETPRTGSRKQRKTGAEKLWSIILTLGRESLLRSIRVLSFSLSSPPTKVLTCVAFYLIINLSAGGTSGWFPDNIGGKPWIDASLSTYSPSPLSSLLSLTFIGCNLAAMRDFALAQDTWSATWPSNPDDRAFRM